MSALLAHRDQALTAPSARHGLRAWMLALQDYLGAFSGLPRPFIDAFEAQASPLSVTCQRLVAITGELLARAQVDSAAADTADASGFPLATGVPHD